LICSLAPTAEGRRIHPQLYSFGNSFAKEQPSELGIYHEPVGDLGKENPGFDGNGSVKKEEPNAPGTLCTIRLEAIKFAGKCH
jgi:hypothetical protein